MTDKERAVEYNLNFREIFECDTLRDVILRLINDFLEDDGSEILYWLNDISEDSNKYKFLALINEELNEKDDWHERILKNNKWLLNANDEALSDFCERTETAIKSLSDEIVRLLSKYFISNIPTTREDKSGIKEYDFGYVKDGVLNWTEKGNQLAWAIYHAFDDITDECEETGYSFANLIEKSGVVEYKGKWTSIKTNLDSILSGKKIDFKEEEYSKEAGKFIADLYYSRKGK
jgi:hypothetical protein